MAQTPMPVMRSDSQATPPMGPIAAGGGAGAQTPSPSEPGAENEIVVTITKNADGGYMVYAGEPPDEGEAEPMPMLPDEGQAADSIGAALKMALVILSDAEKGSGAGPEDQMKAGFDGAPEQKY